jgi:hypothetical protein
VLIVYFWFPFSSFTKKPFLRKVCPDSEIAAELHVRLPAPATSQQSPLFSVHKPGYSPFTGVLPPVLQPPPEAAQVFLQYEDVYWIFMVAAESQARTSVCILYLGSVHVLPVQIFAL